MNCTKVVLGVACCLIYFRAVLFGDDTVELCKVNLVCIAGLDCRCHFRVCGVTDYDTVTSCCAKLLNRSCNLLRYVTLVNIHYINTKSISCFVDDLFTLASKYVCGAPDGNTNCDVVVSCLCCNCAHWQGTNHCCCCCDSNGFSHSFFHVVKPSLKKFAFLIFVSGSLSSRDFRSSVILLNHTLALFS